jgi:hypothetical protein
MDKAVVVWLMPLCGAKSYNKNDWLLLKYTEVG